MNAKIEFRVCKEKVKHWKDMYYEFRLKLKEANAQLDVMRNRISTLEEEKAK